MLILLLINLTGCAVTKWTGGLAPYKKLKIDNDSKSTSNTIINDNKEPLYRSVIDYRYVPVPVPGQLMAMPSADIVAANADKDHHTSGLKAVEEANKKSFYEPQSDQYFNSMLTYIYMPEAIYTVYTSSGKITDIQLESGEKIINIAAADSANWQIQTSPSGEGKNQIMHILIKPIISETGDNTLLILTNKRTYHTYLKMTKNDTFMVSVKWSYPDKQNSLFIDKKGEDKNKEDALTEDGINPALMSFNYTWNSVKKNKPSWFPVQIFHDSSKTYIRFPSDFNDQMVLPILYVPDGNGGYSTMSNWRLIHKNTMTIDGVLQSAMLETGSIKGKRMSVVIKLVPHGQSK